MTRQEVEAEYDVDEWGAIKSPGRFEAEPWWSVVVASWSMDGGGEPLADGAELFELDATDRAAFELDDSVAAVLYRVSEYGFASVEELGARDIERARDRAEEDAGPSEGDYVLSSGRGAAVHVSVFEGTSSSMREGFADDTAALSAIRADMEAGQYWPNVWRMGERGDWTLLRDPFAGL